MLQFVSSVQLVHVVERAIHEMHDLTPENLCVDTRFLAHHNPRWEVTAHFDAGGAHHDVLFVIDPPTGRVRGTWEI